MEKMIKQEVTDTQARILVYLSVVHNTRKYVGAIDAKVGNDYSYTMRVLQRMVQLGWLRKHRLKRKVFYDLTTLAPVEKARNSLIAQNLQRELIESDYIQELLDVKVSTDEKEPEIEEVEDNDKIL
jgi:DNA-binding MarR family transcriptional regulator